MKILVIVAHPDDEVLGMGGTMLKHTKENDTFYCELYIKGKLIIKGEGISKKKSEQDVSQKALVYFNVLT